MNNSSTLCSIRILHIPFYKSDTGIRGQFFFRSISFSSIRIRELYILESNQHRCIFLFNRVQISCRRYFTWSQFIIEQARLIYQAHMLFPCCFRHISYFAIIRTTNSSQSVTATNHQTFAIHYYFLPYRTKSVQACRIYIQHNGPCFIRYCQLVIEISTFIIPYNDSFNTCLTFNLSINMTIRKPIRD